MEGAELVDFGAGNDFDDGIDDDDGGAGFALADDPADDDGGAGFALADDPADGADGGGEEKKDDSTDNAVVDAPSHAADHEEVAPPPPPPPTQPEGPPDPWHHLDPYDPGPLCPRPLHVGFTIRLPPGVDDRPSAYVNGTRTRRSSRALRERLERSQEVRRERRRSTLVGMSPGLAAEAFDAAVARAKRREMAGAGAARWRKAERRPKRRRRGWSGGRERTMPTTRPRCSFRVGSARLPPRWRRIRGRPSHLGDSSSVTSSPTSPRQPPGAAPPSGGRSAGGGSPRRRLAKGAAPAAAAATTSSAGTGAVVAAAAVAATAAAMEHDDLDDDDREGFDFAAGGDDDDSAVGGKNDDRGHEGGNVELGSLDEAFTGVARQEECGEVNSSVDHDAWTFEDLHRARITVFARGAERYAVETNLNKRVGDWQSRLIPILQEEEHRPEFDIYLNGERILGAVRDEVDRQRALVV